MGSIVKKYNMGFPTSFLTDFFRRILREEGFEVETNGEITGYKNGIVVKITFKELDACILSIPRTEVTVTAPPEIHDRIKNRIMLLTAGG